LQDQVILGLVNGVGAGKTGLLPGKTGLRPGVWLVETVMPPGKTVMRPSITGMRDLASEVDAAKRDVWKRCRAP
jgi:hypothetical protein